MLNFIKRIFKDSNTRELQKIMPIVEKSMPWNQRYKIKWPGAKERQRSLKRDSLRRDPGWYIAGGLCSCQEAAQRSTEQKFRHYDVQLMGGIILHQGRIAEMKTGEGKTLVATLPAYLNALTGKGSISLLLTIIWPNVIVNGWDRSTAF